MLLLFKLNKHVSEVDYGFAVLENGGVENSSSKHDNTWYDMQGRKLNAKPTEPGIYIIGGNKILIK